MLLPGANPETHMDFRSMENENFVFINTFFMRCRMHNLSIEKQYTGLSGGFIGKIVTVPTMAYKSVLCKIT